MNEINLTKVDLNLLKSLRALLEEQHVGRSAKRMNVTQSAMSHTLSRLRDVFDDPLFIRHAKGLEPTARALELSGKLGFILGEINTLLAPKTVDMTQVHTHFRIQTHDFIVTSYLAKAFKTIKDKAPNIIIDVQLMESESYAKLENGKLEMIIGAGLMTSPKFMQKRFTNESLVCLLDKENPVLKNWSAEAIFRCPHVRSSLLGDKDDPITQYGKQNGLPERQIGMYVGSLSLQPALLAGSKLIAFLPETLAAQATKFYKFEVRECPFALPTLTIRGMWHERHQYDQVHKWIRDKISNSF
ncbi:LysR family transcriptional regulator [Desulfosediminicola flagellatus]|uniref:LysR family transcriptional regulator n=1 Tax=Desulfosediminicola flagellatus TaxID=2569541 RepID=UPI0010AD0823|nr:LysR family transcriptional regulator [Desulfosediminicola flagellatus]